MYKYRQWMLALGDGGTYEGAISWFGFKRYSNQLAEKPVCVETTPLRYEKVDEK